MWFRSPAGGCRPWTARSAHCSSGGCRRPGALWMSRLLECGYACPWCPRHALSCPWMRTRLGCCPGWRWGWWCCPCGPAALYRGSQTPGPNSFSRWSSPADTRNLPLEEKARERTGPQWPVKSLTKFPCWVLHSRTVLSVEPVAK